MTIAIGFFCSPRVTLLCSRCRREETQRDETAHDWKTDGDGRRLHTVTRSYTMQNMWHAQDWWHITAIRTTYHHQQDKNKARKCSAAFAGGLKWLKCLLTKSKRRDRNPQHVPGGARGPCSEKHVQPADLPLLCGAAPAHQSALEPNRALKWEVRVCKAGSQHFIPDIGFLLLFSCLTERPDRKMWMLIIHLHAGGAFTPMTSGRIKPTRNFWSVSARRNRFLCLCWSPQADLPAQPLYDGHANKS